MPVKITTAIQARNSEVIRDAIATILALELPSQATLTGLTYVNAKIYAEKIGSIQFTETPVINIITTDLKWSDYSAFACKGDYTYIIEVYTNASGTSSSEGDKLAAQKCLRLIGIIQAILMNQAYKYMGLTQKIIMNRQPSGATRAIPRNTDDANNTVMMAIDFKVQTNEIVTAGNSIAFDSSFTDIIITETNNGIEYNIDKTP